MHPDTLKTAPTPNGAGLAAAKPTHIDLLTVLTPAFDTAFAPFPHVVLAVSGGSDSIALLHLAAAWAAARDASGQSSPSFSVVTVDHALRPGSAVEAAGVAAITKGLKLEHTTLVWLDQKPATAIQATARDARLDLIRAHLRTNQRPAIAMAHTADDQAETVFMRLARGSGVDGLAAMRPATPIGAGLTLLRPLLAVTKAEVTAYLVTRSLAWAEDPSNLSPQFERVRIRRARAALAREGLDLDSSALNRTATRMARASSALAQATHDAWAHAGPHAVLNPLGFATLDWDWLLTHPEEIRLRLLTGLLDAIGGQSKRVSLGQLERLTIGNGWQPLTGTVHGVQLRASQSRLLLFREVGRSMPPPVTLQPGANIVWDGRFCLSAPANMPTPLVLSALGRDGVAALRKAKFATPAVPAAVLWTLPSVWLPHRLLVGVPSVNYVAPHCVRSMPTPISISFIGPVFA